MYHSKLSRVEKKGVEDLATPVGRLVRADQERLVAAHGAEAVVRQDTLAPAIELNREARAARELLGQLGNEGLGTAPDDAETGHHEGNVGGVLRHQGVGSCSGKRTRRGPGAGRTPETGARSARGRRRRRARRPRPRPGSATRSRPETSKRRRRRGAGARGRRRADPAETARTRPRRGARFFAPSGDCPAVDMGVQAIPRGPRARVRTIPKATRHTRFAITIANHTGPRFGLEHLAAESGERIGERRKAENRRSGTAATHAGPIRMWSKTISAFK